MSEIIGALKDTPVPTILIIAGILFLLLAISGSLAGWIEVPANRQKLAAVIGSLLLVVGLLMYFVPTPNIKDKGATPTSPQTLSSQPAPPASQATIIYIQYKGDKKTVAEELNIELNRNGFPVGNEVESRNESFNNGIRYFYQEDKEAAASVAKKVNSFFSQKGCDVKFPLEDLSSQELYVQKGQIEIWINLNDLACLK